MAAISAILGGGYLRPTSIVNAHSTTIQAPGANDAIDFAVTPYVRAVNSGPCTASTLKTMLSLTGKGAISYLGLRGTDATSRTHRIKVTLDSTVIFDATSAASTSSRVVSLIGFLSKDSAMNEMPLFFDQNLTIEYASSVTETDKTQLGYIYYLR